MRVSGVSAKGSRGVTSTRDDSVDDAGCVFEAGEDDAVGEGFVLEADVGVEHWAFALAGEVDGEEIGEGEVFAWGAEFVEEAGFVSGDEAAAAFDEGAELVALRVAECGDVGEDEGFVGGEVRGVEIVVVDHLEGDARFDEGLVPAEGGVFDFVGVVIAAVVQGGLLGVDESDASERLLVGEVAAGSFRSRDRSVRRR